MTKSNYIKNLIIPIKVENIAKTGGMKGVYIILYIQLHESSIVRQEWLNQRDIIGPKKLYLFSLLNEQFIEIKTKKID